MEVKTLSYYVVSSVSNNSGRISTLLGLFLAFVGYFLTPEELVSRKILIMIIIVFVTLLLILLNASKIIYDDLHKAHKVQQELQEKLKSNFDRPEVVLVKTPPRSSLYYDDSFAILFTNPTETLPYDSIVSVYFLTDGFEELIAIGKVANIQDDKKVQIMLIHNLQFEKYKENIMGNVKGTLSNIIVKPTMPSFILKGDLYVG